MSEQAPFDPRAVANLMLDVAEEQSIPLTHIALQKLLYFAHGLSLRGGQPLVKGGFEAWTYGPVQPVVYQCFKGSGGNPIVKRAMRSDVITGAAIMVSTPNAVAVRKLLSRVINQYGEIGVGRLIELSHAKGGPWDVIVNKAKTSIALGMRIPDNIIVERFVNHKITVGVGHAVGVADDEDTPLAGNGPC